MDESRGYIQIAVIIALSDARPGTAETLPTRQTESSVQRFSSQPPPMEPASFNLGTVLLATSGLFCLATLYFGTRGGYYDTDDYDGNGTAH